ncbi:nucleotide-diphospho-sugar transferase [Thelephora ganbajun]|uniref:Nucleotide-diphospho-sugar transferase n=1 Tax=Thelephora ganbajun TaxID=370292 RepID=A0ACB6ZQF4_THEGA|nr:nucleotide-diphospho-sugar transferase [Thelephora ganbajun]
MPPKGPAAKDKDIAPVEEDVIQAVILAESFNKRFKPLTIDRPRCLLPICNAPLLDWTLESLALAGVQEIFVVCRSHPDLVKAAIKESKWSKPGSGLKIVPIVTAKQTFTSGDALRDIYTHGIITNDFVLVTGDLVSNVRIDEVVRVHKERRKGDRDAIMTMVVKESGVVHRTRSKGESAVFVVDPETDQLLHYEPVTGYPPTKIARIPREVLNEHPECEIRYDLIDCSIDICSVEVPSLFQDNFDYGHIRRDFVHGVLTSDLLMKNIYTYVAKGAYAARVQDTKSYDAISRDILSRWTFPLVPDNNHPSSHAYEHRRGNKYFPQDNTVILSRTCTVGTNTLIGSHSQIFDNAVVSSSVIGRRCKVLPRAKITNSYIFDGTTIEADCVITNSIIGSMVHVKEGTVVEKGCLIADEVVVGPKGLLKEFERVSKKVEKPSTASGTDDEDEDSELEDVDEEQLEKLRGDLGTDSNAFVWPPRTSNPEDEETDEIENSNNQRLMRLGDDAPDLHVSDAESISTSCASSPLESDVEDNVDESLSSASSDASVSTPVTSSKGISKEELEFKVEVTQSLERAFEEGHSVDNAAVELKTLRMASNVPLTRVREAIIAALVDQIRVVSPEEGPAKQKAEVEKVVERWGELINKIGGVDGVETISTLQNHCATTDTQLFGQVLVAFYQSDIIDEDDLKNWQQLPVSKTGQDDAADNHRKFWVIGSRILQQLVDQESEEESEDEDDE